MAAKPSIFDNVPVPRTAPTAVDLGLQTIVKQMADQMQASVNDFLARSEAATIKRVQEMLQSHTPTVNVAAAPVTVGPAQVDVHVPQVLPPDVEVTVPGLESFAVELRRTNTLLERLLAVADRPVTRTLVRDSQGLVQSMTDKR